MTVALLVMTDGRDTVFRTVRSAKQNLGDFDELWMHDDSGDPANAEVLRTSFPEFTLVTTTGRSGFGGAIRNAWSTLRDHSHADFVFHLEDDFLFNRPFDVRAMSSLLARRPYLLNLALRRQPWNPQESAAGGIVEQWPDEYTEVTDGDHTWLEHRLFFTTNPGLYRRSLLETHDWPPQPSDTERIFSTMLLEDHDLRFGYYGARDSGEAVFHIGHQRNGTGY